jgi:hypothetical protein
MDKRPPSLVVMGGSAGGVEALTTVAAGLPADLGAAVGVVLHLRAGAESRLAEILSRAGPLPATQAVDGERLERGCVYVAPPDRHLLVQDSHCVVARGPQENGLRPSVDVLFRRAALAFGLRTVAVVLSGARDDGAAGEEPYTIAILLAEASSSTRVRTGANEMVKRVGFPRRGGRSDSARHPRSHRRLTAFAPWNGRGRRSRAPWRTRGSLNASAQCSHAHGQRC